MRVLVAPDSFGGALDSVAVATAIATGWRATRPDDSVVMTPMADGGEGTLAAVAAAQGERAELRSTAVHDPLGREVVAEWLLLDEGREAFIEMAAASGLARLAEGERTPATARAASTRGTGELVLAALEAGVTRIVLGLGGSATTDGGAGLLSGLGARFLDASRADLPPGGAALAGLARIDASALDRRLRDVELVVASDVTNPLTGPAGAAAVYGPQKGADAAAVAELDAALGVLGAAIQAATDRAVADLPGSGAAGGTAAALLGFTAATLRPGFEVVAELAGLRAALGDADLVITGEGAPTSRRWPARRRWAWRSSPARRGFRWCCCAVRWGRVPSCSRRRASSTWCSRSRIGRWPWPAPWPIPSGCWSTPPNGWRAPSRWGSG